MAQPDRATDFGSVGWGFESLRARHFQSPSFIFQKFYTINSNFPANLKRPPPTICNFFIDNYINFINIHCVLMWAGIAQLVEHDLAKVGVAGSSPVSRSIFVYRQKRRHSQVAKAQVCKTLIPGSNPGAASIYFAGVAE